VSRPTLKASEKRKAITIKLPLWLTKVLKIMNGSQGRIIEEALISHFKLVEKKTTKTDND